MDTEEGRDPDGPTPVADMVARLTDMAGMLLEVTEEVEKADPGVRDDPAAGGIMASAFGKAVTPMLGTVFGRYQLTNFYRSRARRALESDFRGVIQALRLKDTDYRAMADAPEMRQFLERPDVEGVYTFAWRSPDHDVNMVNTLLWDDPAAPLLKPHLTESPAQKLWTRSEPFTHEDLVRIGLSIDKRERHMKNIPVANDISAVMDL